MLHTLCKRKTFYSFIALGTRHTVGVVGIDAGVGSVPALDESIGAAAVTLLSIAAHYHTEHRTSGRLKSISVLKNNLIIGLTKSKYLVIQIAFYFSALCNE